MVIEPSPEGRARGETDVVKVLDFGFAKVPLERFSATVADALTVTAKGTIFGTVGYMAPETAYGMHAVTHLSDLYAVGVIFYELLTGKHPFDPTEPRALFRCHQETPPPPIRERAPGVRVPHALEAVVMRLLEKAPEDRYPSAVALIDAIDGALAAPNYVPTPRPPPRAPSSADLDPVPAPASAAPDAQRGGAPAGRGRPLLAIAIVVLLAASAWLYLRSSPAGRAWLAGLTDGEGSAGSSAPAGATTARPTASAATVAPVGSVRPAASAAAAASASAGALGSAAPPTGGSVDGLDAAKWRAVLREAATTMDPSRGAKAFLALAELDAGAFGEPDIVPAAASAAVGIEIGDRATADKVFEHLGSAALGSGGPDVLFQMTSYYGGSRGAIRAAALLEKPEVMARASPALRVAMALRDAPCEEKPALFERAAAEGDGRTLSILSRMISPECDSASGACCRAHDPKLAGAFAKLRARVPK